MDLGVWQIWSLAINELMNHKAVCRTAPATPGLIITQVTIEHRKWPKMDKNGKKAEQSSPQELKEGLHSGPYFLIFSVLKKKT